MTLFPDTSFVSVSKTRYTNQSNKNYFVYRYLLRSYQRIHLTALYLSNS